MTVWDLPVRLLHWTLVLAIATAWLSTLGVGGVSAHEPAGYVALAAVLLRVVWGFTGPTFARFAQFICGYTGVWRYARQLRAGTAPRYIGHNPLGGWMVLALLACVISLGVTGWLYTTDAFWGEAWLDRLHHLLAWALLVLVALHLAGVLFTSLHHRENLLISMFSGHKKHSLTLENIDTLL
jgi:cytochrome b